MNASGRETALGAALLRTGVLASVCGSALALAPDGLEPYGPTKALALFGGAAVCALAVALLARERGTRLLAALRSPTALALLALAGLLALATVTARDPLRALTGGYPGYLGLIALLACLAVCGAASIADDRDRVFLRRAAVVTALAVSLSAIVQILGFDPLSYRAGLDLTRAWSTLGNASTLGLWLATALPLIAHSVLTEEQRPWFALAAASALASGAAIALTGSRGALLALVVSAVAGAVFVRRASGSGPARAGAARETRLAALGAAVVALVAVALVAPGAARLASDSAAGGTGAGRIAVWRGVVPLVAERPVLGWGVGGFSAAYPRFARADAADPRGRGSVLESPHNLELSAAAAGGLPAALALLAALGLFGVATWRATGTARESSSRLAAATSAAALVALVAGSQVHFLAVPTAALGAWTLGDWLAATTCGEGSLPDGAHAAARPALTATSVALAVALGLAATAAGSALAADRALARAFSAAAAGDTPATVTALAAARSRAPWEPALDWAAGRAATDLVGAGDARAADAGVTAFDRALDRSGEVPALMRDRADLLLSAALTSQDRSGYRDSLAAYDAVLEIAPADPLAWLGRGASLASLGRLDEATIALEQATALAPRNAAAWSNLASVYRAQGREGDAAQATARAGEGR